MQSCIDASSVAFAIAGLIVLLSATLLRLRWAIAVPIAVELWTAVGLLRLLGEPSWSRIAAVGSMVVIRQLLTTSRGEAINGGGAAR
jgi:hypothetical protein